MDNIITGGIAVAIFLAFTLGLAESIGALPFFVIVITVCTLLLIDFYQSAREGLEEERKKKADSPQS